MGGFPDPVDALDAAAARAIDAADPAPVAEPAPVPFGQSLEIDVERRRYRRSGQRPVVTQRVDTLRNWCTLIAHSARGAHRSLPPDVGVVSPDGPVGYGADRADAAADWALEVRQAWLAHDRITDVVIDAVVIDTEGMQDTSRVDFTILYDDEERLDIAIPLEPLEAAA